MKGSEIAALRKDAELTQKELAELLGVHRVTLANWERLDSQVSRATEIAIQKIIEDDRRSFDPRSRSP